jgi:hypothetical protein
METERKATSKAMNRAMLSSRPAPVQRFGNPLSCTFRPSSGERIKPALALVKNAISKDAHSIKRVASLQVKIGEMVPVK